MYSARQNTKQMRVKNDTMETTLVTKQLRFFLNAFLIFSVILFCLLSSGCGFKLRSHDSQKINLSKVYLSTERPYSPLTTGLCALLHAAGVQLVKHRKQAKYALVITKDVFSASEPEIVNASLPSTIGFSKTATLVLKNNRNHTVIAKKTFEATRALTLNRNQIYTKNANPDIQKSLNDELILFINYWLVTNTESLSKHTTGHHHRAIKSKPIPHPA